MPKKKPVNKIAMKLKPSVDPSGYVIAHIIINGEDVMSIWCNHIGYYGQGVYCFDLNGFNVSSICTKDVEVDPILESLKRLVENIK